jgi:hypothetical protein
VKAHAIYIAIIILLLLLTLFAFDRYRQAEVEKVAYVAAGEELKREIDKAGREIVTKSQVIVSSERQYRKLNLQFDSLHVELQKSIRKLKGKVSSASLISTTTDFESASPTTRDTVSALVIYKGAHKDEWIEWSGEARSDSFLIHVIVENKYQFTEVVRNPLFKPKETTVQVVNLNPYTRTNSIASFTVKSPSKKFGIGPQIGYGIDAKSGQLSFNVGIGVQRQIVQF